MVFLRVILRYASWLSIDVTLGAMAGMLFFERLLRAQLHWPAYVLLGLAVWSIYTLDHLLDVRKKTLLLSERRAFHLRNWRTLALLLSLTVLIGLLGAWWWFGWGRELQMTVLLALLIVLSKLLVRKSGLGWLKELSIAVFYVLGIVWLPWLRADIHDLVWQTSFFLPMYMAIAFLNLLMLSSLDQDEDEQAGFFSAAWTLPPGLLVMWIRRLAIAVIFTCLAAFISLSSFFRPFACILLLMALIHYLTFFHKDLSREQRRMRMELSFILPALLIFL